MSSLKICARCGKSLPETAYRSYQTSGDIKTGTWRLRKTCKACMTERSNHYSRIRRARQAALGAGYLMTEREGMEKCMKRWAWMYQRWQA